MGVAFGGKSKWGKKHCEVKWSQYP